MAVVGSHPAAARRLALPGKIIQLEGDRPFNDRRVAVDSLAGRVCMLRIGDLPTVYFREPYICYTENIYNA